MLDDNKYMSSTDLKPTPLKLPHAHKYDPDACCKVFQFVKRAMHYVNSEQGLHKRG